MTLLDDVYRQKANIKNIRERERSERIEAIYKKYPEFLSLENEKNSVLNDFASMNFTNYEDINKKILDIEAKKQKLCNGSGQRGGGKSPPCPYRNGRTQQFQGAGRSRPPHDGL